MPKLPANCSKNVYFNRMKNDSLADAANEILVMAKKESENLIQHTNARMHYKAEADTYWAAANQIRNGTARDMLIGKARSLDSLARQHGEVLAAKEEAVRAMRVAAKRLRKEHRKQKTAFFFSALAQRFSFRKTQLSA